MATFDAHANLALARIVSAPSPALSGTSLQIDVAYVSLFPTAPFNATVYPPTVAPTAANAEIVRVTAIVGNTFTIVRAQEGTTAKAIASNWLIANTTSKKVFTDIEAAIAISAGTSNAQGPFVFADSNNVSFGMSNGTLTASAAGGGGTGGVAISAGTSSQGTGTIVFADSNNMQFGMSNGSVTASAIVASFLPGFSASNGSSTYAAVLTFTNGNGISFINSNGSVAASHNGLTSQSSQVASASNGSFAFQTIAFSNANNVTFGTSAGSIITASVNAGGGGSINFSAGTTSGNFASVTFADSNGVSFGINNGTITASVNAGAAGNPASFWQNEPAFSMRTNFSLSTNAIRGAVAFLPYDMSLGYIRIPAFFTQSFALAPNLGAGFTNTQVTIQAQSTWYAMIYTTGTGASSTNMMLLSSGSVGWTALHSMSVGTASTQQSFTQIFSYGLKGSNTSHSNSYTVAAAGNYQFGSDPYLTNFSASRWIDINFNGSLSKGAYVVMFGLITSTATNHTNFTLVTQVAPQYSQWFGIINASDFAFTDLGKTQNSSLGLDLQMGAVLTTAASSTYTAVPITSFINVSSGIRPLFQFARTA